LCGKEQNYSENLRIISWENKKFGDLVLSAPENDPTGPVTARRVEEVFQRMSRLMEIRVGGRTIQTTHEHPFYVEGKGWKQACALQPGDLLKSHAGAFTPVESLRDTELDVPVYNMRIAEYHTYFVGDEAWGFDVWVHNSDYKTRLARDKGDIPRSAQPTRQGGGNGGRWWEYKDNNGQTKIVVKHPDGSVHVGTPKPQSTHGNGGPPKYYPVPGSGHVGELPGG
jgi:hypothetical protein